MSRAPGASRSLVLPAPLEKYDATNERETRRLIEQNSRLLSDWTALASVPTPVTALGTLTGAADKVPYFTGVSTMALAALTPYARTILACADAATMRTTLGLGPLAILGVPSDATKFLNGAASPAFAQVKGSDLSMADVTTNNVSSTAHGFTPKSPADATQFLNGAATPAFAQVKGADLSMADVTTNDVSITKHGFTPKAPNDTTKFLRGDGTWAAPAGGGGGSPAALTDTTDLAAWYSADAAGNTVAANTGQITVFTDLTGNGRTFTPGTGRIQKVYGGLAGLPIAFFAAGLTSISSITIPLKGAMTFFGVFQITSTTAYQNLFKPLAGASPSDMHLYWDQPTNKWQVNGSVAGSGVAGSYVTLLIHFFNSGGNLHYKVRQNGASILGDTASTIAGHPISGTSGTPVNFTLNLFLDAAASTLKFTSRIAEWGFYAVSKDGTESTLEDYLRAKWGTW